ncbi:putative isomerase YbhE [Aspergillus heteromorphus CBS 117.55]|uniref:Putative isomerase YbhE n=1 Tax=Aspergillus heteromorphus CBS 117.55 TaxID=1448321 RepID=A0A317V4X7_9EURO|nr:putative isomerase YbhE [Aspergillus heteromorphus CBS 117.55]PWY67917.1 putative isomerase YbhE [Aspergillus heteromorphus CBS 117.55]
MKPSIIPLIFGTTAVASRLYAASYAGTVTTLSLTKSQGGAELTTLAQSTDCGINPSWLMLDQDHRVLYCLDEAVDESNGTLTSFAVNANGSLARITQMETMAGPVQSHFYSAPGLSNRNEGSAVTSYSLDPITGVFNRSQTFTYELAEPGPVPDRQDASHCHGVVVDPTGQFVLVPDLGADLVRIFRVNPYTGLLEPQEPLVAAPGSGPRHGVFWTPKGATSQTKDVLFYLTSELSNHLTGYKVTYPTNRTISFDEFYTSNTYGGLTPPNGSKVAEVAISPENNRIVVSNRGDNTFGAGNDSIGVFTCADASGHFPTNVTFGGLYPAYGNTPRQFEMATQTGIVAEALQSSHAVAVTGWDGEAEKPGPLLARKSLEGEVVAVVWDN